MRRFAAVPLCIAVSLALAGAAGARPATTLPALVRATTILVSGHGYGHGIGMSQYGARGYASHGFDHAQILAHYYPGTVPGPAPRSRIRVLLAEHQRRLAISSEAPFRVRDGAGTLHALPAGSLALDPTLAVPLADGLQAALPGPLTFLSGRKPLALAGKPYRGTLTVHSRAGRIDCVNTLGLDAYVAGVVTLEMPRDWPAQALAAQAVAARSYALASRSGVGGVFDVYGDTRSQVYGGLGAETAEGRAAVAATKGEVLLYGGKVAWTYFSSSSGGRTADISDEWPDARPLPYLVSVDDPYDLETSPYSSWGPVALGAERVARALQVPGKLVSLEAQPGPSGRVATVLAVGTRGTKAIRGTDFRLALGLRSTWVELGQVSLERPAAPLPYGSALRLAGAATGVEDPQLEQRTGGGAWTVVRTLAPAADGSFSLALRPLATTEYRLVAGEASGANLRVRVARAVTLTTVAPGVGGTVAPAAPGATVELQSDDGTGVWTPVAQSTVDATGAFAFPDALPAGSYRARVAAGGGLLAGLSATLVLP